MTGLELKQIKKRNVYLNVLIENKYKNTHIAAKSVLQNYIITCNMYLLLIWIFI